MLSRRKQLSDARLYLILDTAVNRYEEIFAIARLSILGGVDIIQLRDKSGSDEKTGAAARQLSAVIAGRVPFILNDRPDLAAQTGCDGVHLGQQDGTIESARKTLGDDAIIGSSCQNLDHLEAAMKSKADYIGFGSVFQTLTKPDRQPLPQDLLKKAFARSRIPLFAIGGISLENLPLILEKGVTRVAVCRAICQARDIRKTTQRFKETLQGYQEKEKMRGSFNGRISASQADNAGSIPVPRL